MERGIFFLQRHRSTGLFILGGILLGIGFLVTFLWPVGLFGIALCVEALLRAQSWQEAACGFFLAWTLKALFGISWFWTTYPVDVFSSSFGSVELVVIGFYWLTTGIALGVTGIVLGLGLWFLYQRLALRWFLLCVPPLWLMAEVTSSGIFSLFTLGEGSSLNFVFSVGYVGYLLAHHSLLLMLAAFWGVYGLTIIMVATGIGIWLLVKRFSATPLYWVLSSAAIFFILSVTSHFSVPTNAEEVKNSYTVAIIDTTFGRSAYHELVDKESYRQNQINEALRAALATGVDYVVMPEDSRLSGPTISPAVAHDRFRFLYQDPSVIVVEAGRYHDERGAVYLRASIFDGKEKTHYSFDKTYLVPQGEYVPYFYSTVLTLLGYENTVASLKTSLNYSAGLVTDQSILPQHLPGILFCYEQKNPLAVRHLVKKRNMPFVAHPISHAWFHTPTAMWDQYDAMLKVQAVWNNVPIVSAGNMATGYLYLPSGEKVSPTTVASGQRWIVSLVSW